MLSVEALATCPDGPQSPEARDVAESMQEPGIFLLK